MKKLLLTILIAFTVLGSIMLGACSCNSGYSSYDDFMRRGTTREHEQFYDWWSRNR